MSLVSMTTFVDGMNVDEDDFEPLRLNILDLDTRVGSGIVAYGRRTTASANATDTTGVGVLRLDDIPVISGRAYEISINNFVLKSTVSLDYAASSIVYTTDGSTPSTSSTELPKSRAQGRVEDTSNGFTRTVLSIYTPSANETLSILLKVMRLSGTGNVTIFANTTAFPVEMYVRDLGVRPADTGTVIP